MSSVPEVIAKLDVFERELLDMVRQVKEFRHELFETLDHDPDSMVE